MQHYMLCNDVIDEVVFEACFYDSYDEEHGCYSDCPGTSNDVIAKFKAASCNDLPKLGNSKGQ